MAETVADTAAVPADQTSSLRHNVKYGILLAICLVLLYLFVIRDMHFYRVPSSSMEPTLMPGDFIMTLSNRDYHRGDVIVLDDPEEAGGHLVKRIIGLPGDTLRIADGALFINGEYASEPFTRDIMDYTMPDYTVPPDQVFVLGDNRNYSDDSHLWQNKGVDMSTIVGRVRLVYLPFGRFHVVRPFPLRNVSGQ